MRKLFIAALLCVCSTWNIQAQEPPCGALYAIPYTEAFEPAILTLPNTSPFNQVDGPRLVVTSLGKSPNVIQWLGTACDLIFLPVGSEIRVTVPNLPAWQDYEFLEQYIWTLEFTGWLSWRYAPVA